MQKSILKISGLLFLFIAIGFTACKSNASQNGVGGTLAADAFEKKMNETADAQIADVRTPGEYSDGHIKNAINIDWNGDAFETEIQKMDKTKPVFVYCLSGGRSAGAVNKMVDMGFKEIYELDGGMRAWSNAQKLVDMGVVLTEKTETVAKSKGMSMAEYKDVLKTDKLVLVDFNAVWCAPCKEMAPMLEEVAITYKDKLIFLKMDVEENKAVADELKIEYLPTLVLYKNGAIVWSAEGLTLKEPIVNAINKNI